MKTQQTVAAALLAVMISPIALGNDRNEEMPPMAAVEAAAPRWAEGHILVQPRPGLPEEEFTSIIEGKGGRSMGRIRGLSVHKVKVPEKAEDAIARALARNPHIKFAEKDMLVAASETLPNDPQYGSAWHLPMIQAPNAWDFSQGDGITLAVLDTGVDGEHPDLASQMIPGWNVVSDNNDTSDIAGHGTAVAGTAAAASNNATGVASVAWHVRLMPVRITNRSDSWAYWSDIATAL